MAAKVFEPEPATHHELAAHWTAAFPHGHRQTMVKGSLTEAHNRDHKEYGADFLGHSHAVRKGSSTLTP